jgi:TonB family protein
MMPLRLLTVAAATLLALTPLYVFAAQPKVTTSVPLSDVLASMPRPEYPLEARQRFITGRGMYQVIFRPETGAVIRVSVLQSTGSKILDDAAVKALSRWRARPGRLSRMHVPFTFTFAQ